MFKSTNMDQEGGDEINLIRPVLTMVGPLLSFTARNIGDLRCWAKAQKKKV